MSTPSVGIYRLLRPWLRPLRVRLLLIGFCAALVGVMVAFQPLLVRWIIDDGLLRPVEGPPEVVAAERWRATLGWVGIFALASLSRIGLWSLGYRRLVATLEELQRNVRAELFRHLQRLCLRYHDRHASGEAFNAIMGSPISSIRSFIQEWSLTVPYQLVAGVVVVVGLAWADPQLTLVTVLLAAGVAWSARGSQRAVRERSQLYLDEESRVARRVADLLHGLRETKLQGREAEAEELVEHCLTELHAQGRSLLVEQHRYHMRPEAARYLAQGLLFAFGGWRCLHGELGVGAFVAFIMVFDTLMQPLLTALRLGVMMASARAAADRIAGILAERSSTPEPAQPRPWPDPAPGLPVIALRGVGFGYESGRPVFNGLELCLETGRSVALVGSSGSGKSTLVSLMLRLYDVEQGRIEINGIDIRELALRRLRASFAVVPQQPYIFARSLRENLLVAAPQADEAELWSALEAAQLAAVVRELPEGLDSELGEGGCTLSGGQRQRLAIARALLTHAPVLILDEATSALDNESESLVQRALTEVMRTRTVIVIAHRLSTVRHVDRVLVLDQGRVVEDGPYEELAAGSGAFRRLLDAAGARDAA